MTIAQIMAVLSLLLAFGVDQPTVNSVETILRAQQSVTIRVMEKDPVFEAKPKVEGVVVEPAQPEQKKKGYAGTLTPVGGTFTTSPNQQ